MQDLKTNGCDNSALKITKIVLMIVFAVALTLFVAAEFRNSLKEYDYIGKSAEQRDVISISGEGKVVAVPDIATISLGLETEKKDVAQAQQENTDKINALIKDLKDFDIEEKDIKTSSYNIYPSYDWTQDEGRKLKGYIVNQNVEVKIRDLKNISNVLNLASKYNLNQVGGLSFTIDEIESVRQEARLKALEQAKEKAEALADAAGVKLGKIVSFSESTNDYAYPMRDMMVKAEAYGLGGAEEAMPDIEAGSQEVIIYVTVEYEIL